MPEPLRIIACLSPFLAPILFLLLHAVYVARQQAAPRVKLYSAVLRHMRIFLVVVFAALYAWQRERRGGDTHDLAFEQAVLLLVPTTVVFLVVSLVVAVSERQVRANAVISALTCGVLLLVGMWSFIQVLGVAMMHAYH